MLHIPTVYPSIIFAIVAPGTLSTRKHVVEGFYELAMGIFRMEKMGFGMEQVPVVERLLHEVLIIRLFTQRLGQLGEAPGIVSGTQRNRYRLPALKGVDFGDGLFLSFPQGGDIAVFFEKRIQLSRGCARPRRQCF